MQDIVDGVLDDIHGAMSSGGSIDSGMRIISLSRYSPSHFFLAFNFFFVTDKLLRR